MNIYFSGIGGVGIGPLAEIARDMGYTVMGSDLSESLVTEELRAQGVPVTIGQDGSFLAQCHESTPLNWFVYTAALPEDHPELVRAKELGIRIAKRDEFLAFVLAERNLKLIAISGTHGKTTTTGMAIWTLEQLGIPISYSVGTTLAFGPSGKFDPNSEFFVYECDEFDRNFLHFFPYIAIIASVDYDHPDTYPEESEYTEAFRQFITQSEHTILWQKDADYIQGGFEKAQLVDTPLDIALHGEHNRRNATLVVKAMEYLQLGDASSVISILDQFPGTDRRFEKLGENLYTDYGHHPEEIAATLQMARELSDHVVLVYQPHQNKRQYHIRDQYTTQFEQAETVYWLPTYLSRDDPTMRVLTPEELIANITNRDAIHIADFNDDLWQAVEQARAAGKLVLFMGAGSIDSWARLQLEKTTR